MSGAVDGNPKKQPPHVAYARFLIAMLHGCQGTSRARFLSLRCHAESSALQTSSKRQMHDWDRQPPCSICYHTECSSGASSAGRQSTACSRHCRVCHVRCSPRLWQCCNEMYWMLPLDSRPLCKPLHSAVLGCTRCRLHVWQMS